jgi:hypothetical protein
MGLPRSNGTVVVSFSKRSGASTQALEPGRSHFKSLVSWLQPCRSLLANEASWRGCSVATAARLRPRFQESLRRLLRRLLLCPPSLQPSVHLDRLARARLIRYTCRQIMLIRASWNPAGPRSCPLYGLCWSWRTAYSMVVQYGDPRLRFPRLRRVSQSCRYVKLLPYPLNDAHGSLDGT